MRKNSAYQAQNGVEFRESGVDEGVGHHVVALGYAHDTVGANLTLTDTGEQDADTCSKAHTKANPSADGAAGVFAHHHQESHETVNTLGRGECGQQQVATGSLRFAFECTFGRVTGDGGADGGAETRQCNDESESEIS